MEIILLLVGAANLAATAYVGKLVLRREEYRVEFIQIPPEYLGLDLVDEPVSESQPEEQKETPQPEPTQQSKPTTKTYSAWENRTNIPWVESPNPPQQPVSLTQKGPLERPDGFI